MEPEGQIINFLNNESFDIDKLFEFVVKNFMKKDMGQQDAQGALLNILDYYNENVKIDNPIKNFYLNIRTELPTYRRYLYQITDTNGNITYNNLGHEMIKNDSIIIFPISIPKTSHSSYSFQELVNNLINGKECDGTPGNNTVNAIEDATYKNNVEIYEDPIYGYYNSFKINKPDTYSHEFYDDDKNNKKNIVDKLRPYIKNINDFDNFKTCNVYYIGDTNPFKKFIIFSLKIWNYNKTDGTTSKIDFTLNNYLNITIKNVNYELIAVVVHQGIANDKGGSGHYVTYVHNNKNWKCCNDTSIDDINNLEDEINKNDKYTPYILLYEQSNDKFKNFINYDNFLNNGGLKNCGASCYLNSLLQLLRRLYISYSKKAPALHAAAPAKVPAVHAAPAKVPAVHAAPAKVPPASAAPAKVPATLGAPPAAPTPTLLSPQIKVHVVNMNMKNDKNFLKKGMSGRPNQWVMNDINVGVMIAGNYGRPGGATMDTGVFTSIPNTKTQDESVLSYLHSFAGNSKIIETKLNESYEKYAMEKKNPNDVDYYNATGLDGNKFNIKNAGPEKYKDELFGFFVNNGKGDSNAIYISYVAGPNASIFKSNPDKPFDTMHRTQSSMAKDNYSVFVEMIANAMMASLEGMNKNGVQKAIIAPLSTGVYAGNHKSHIKTDIETISKNVIFAFLNKYRSSTITEFIVPSFNYESFDNSPPTRTQTILPSNNKYQGPSPASPSPATPVHASPSPATPVPAPVPGAPAKAPVHAASSLATIISAASQAPTTKLSVDFMTFPFRDTNTKKWIFDWKGVGPNEYYIWGANENNYYLSPSRWKDGEIKTGTYIVDVDEHGGGSMATVKPHKQYVGIITMASSEDNLEKWTEMNKEVVGFLESKGNIKIHLPLYNGGLGLGTGIALDNANSGKYQDIWLRSIQSILQQFVNLDSELGDKTLKFPGWDGSKLAIDHTGVIFVKDYLKNIDDMVKEIERQKVDADVKEKKERADRQKIEEETEKILSRDEEERKIKEEQKNIYEAAKNKPKEEVAKQFVKHLENQNYISSDELADVKEVAMIMDKDGIEKVFEQGVESKLAQKVLDKPELIKEINETFIQENEAIVVVQDSKKKVEQDIHVSQLYLQKHLHCLHILQKGAAKYIEFLHKQLLGQKGGGDAILRSMDKRIERRTKEEQRKKEAYELKLKRLKEEVIDLKDPKVVREQFEMVHLPPNRISAMSSAHVDFFWIPDGYQWYELSNRQKNIYTIWVIDIGNSSENVLNVPYLEEDTWEKNVGVKDKDILIKIRDAKEHALNIWKADYPKLNKVLNNVKSGGKSIKRRNKRREKTQRSAVVVRSKYIRGGAKLTNFYDVLLVIQHKDKKYGKENNWIDGEKYMRELGDAIHECADANKPVAVVMRKLNGVRFNDGNNDKSEMCAYWSAVRIVLGGKLEKNHKGSQVRIVASEPEKRLLFEHYLTPASGDKKPDEREGSVLLQELEDEEMRARVSAMSYDDRMKYFAGEVTSDEKRVKEEVMVRMKRQEEMDKRGLGVGAFAITSIVSSLFGIVAVVLFSPL